MYTLGLFALFTMSAVAPATAHEVGLGDQILAPLTAIPTLLPLLAVSLLCRQHDDVAVDRALAVVMGLGMTAGLAARIFAAGDGGSGSAPLALALIAGALVAWAGPLPRGAIVLFVLAVGLAVGWNLHVETTGWIDIGQALAAGFFGAFAALLMLATTANPAPFDWHRIGVRVAGSWITATAILVFALGARGAA